MDQIKGLIASLSTRQRIAIVAAVVLLGVALTAVTRWHQESGFHPLYTSLSQEDAAGILQKLKESGVPYRLSDGGSTVRVPSDRVAELRLELAASGLPHSGRIGFELFDRTNFGTTDFAEQVNYRRAVEGELERSVMSLAEVEMARVHVTFPKNSVYVEAREEAKASVLVKIRPGMQLTAANVLAIAHLVSSAVESLKPEYVSVLDMHGNLLSRPRRGGNAAMDTSGTMLEYQHTIEASLLRKINDTLDPLLGSGRYRAGLSVECDFTSGEQSEETFQPDKSVMTSSTRTEDVQHSPAPPGGIPGTASTLPRPNVKTPSGGNETIRRSENITYQTSRLVKKLNLPQGSVRKISASILLDHAVSWENRDGKLVRVLTPPPPEKVKSIHDIVAGAIGLSEQRGDQLIVESLPFEPTLPTEPPASLTAPGSKAPPPSQPVPLWQQQNVLIGAGAGVVILTAAGFFLLRKKKKKVKAAEMAKPLPPGTVAAALAGPAHHADEQAALPDTAAGAPALLPEAPSELQKLEDLTRRMRQSAKSNPSPYVNVVRNWLTEETRH